MRDDDPRAEKYLKFHKNPVYWHYQEATDCVQIVLSIVNSIANTRIN